MNEAVHYILSFLLQGNESAMDQVNYASTPDPNTSCRLTILGGGLDTDLHYPDLSAPEIEQLPNGHYVIHTDLVYNTFFFISRAEEVLNSQRDQYGRFLAQYSKLSSNDWQIPLVDEYSRLILKLLNLPMQEAGFSAIHLTHDIDILSYYRHLRGALGGIYRGQGKKVWASWRNIHNDPAYTFPWMIEKDAACSMRHAACDVIYFVKHTSGKGLDYPQYCLRGRDWRVTSNILQASGARMGVHSSAYTTCPLVQGREHRSHYLNCSVERMQQLVDAGYTDDYSMGFADLAGFRLQTTRAVRWINPVTKHLSSLTLHPLTVMDCTLSNANYMHLNEDEAYFHVARLIDKVRQHHGEVNLLWHNTVFADNSYHKTLYPKILALL